MNLTNLNTSFEETESFAPSIAARLDHWLCSYWLVFGFFVFLTGFFWLPSTHSYKVIIPGVLLVPALLSLLSPQRWRLARRHGALLLLVLLYLVYMCAIAFWRGQEDVDGTLKWSIYTAVFLFGIGFGMRIATSRLLQLLLIGAVVAAAAAVYAAAVDLRSGAFWDAEYRLTGYGTLYNPLRSGHLWGAFAALALWCVYCDVRLWNQRWPAWLAALLGVAAVLSSGSRAPMLALLAVVVWVVIADTHGRRRWLYLLLTAAGTMILGALFWHVLSKRGLSLRPDIWPHVLELCKAHPWFGVGLGHALEIRLPPDFVFYDTHNVFLAALYYGGAIGLVLFLAAFGAAFWWAWQRRAVSALCGMAAVLQLYGLVTLQFDGGSLISRPSEFWVLYWLPMALYLQAVTATDSATEQPS